MKNLKNINEFWGAVIRRDMSSAVREEDKFHSKEELRNYLAKEIEKQGENVVIKNLDVSGIEDLSELLFGVGVGNVKSIDFSGWKTDNATTIEAMFYQIPNVESINLSGWNTSNITDMNYLFTRCFKLVDIDLTGWDTSKVTDMSKMFAGCISLTSLDLSGWDTSNVNDMSYMFWNCTNLKFLDLAGWDTKSIKSMNNMFFDCPAPYKVVNNKIVRR